jgi:hypothetical protein
MKLLDYDTEKAFDYENGFYLTSDIRRMGKLLAHFRLYSQIMNLPGHVVECGVFKGASFIRFATFRELFESSYSRKIIGFDTFGKFPSQKNPEDDKYAKEHNEQTGTGISASEFEKVLKHKNITNYELVIGDINETVPEYVKKNPQLKIAMLHIDVDVYEPTMTILKNLYHKVVPSGLIVLDDYSTVQGETRAVDEFFAKKKIKMSKFKFSHIPVYFRKNEYN